MNKKKSKTSGTFKIGAISLAFMILGYQIALFVHKAAAERIVANRDHPDTVYVLDRAVAEDLLQDEGLRAQVSDEIARSGLGSKGVESAVGRKLVRESLEDGAAKRKVGEEGKDAASEGGRNNEAGSSYGTGGNKAGSPNPDTGQIIVRKQYAHSAEAKDIAQKYSPRKAENFAFNPNTASIDDFIRLGFSEKQAQSIDKYRNSGGRFYRKSDFAKSYVVSEEVYQRLEKYISIPLTDINTADSAAFDALPGIGGWFAKNMVAYRERLHGYSCKEQLMEIYRFDEQKYSSLKDLISCSAPKPYPLWTAPADSLRLHPHIGSIATARAVVFYREHNSKENWTIDGLFAAGILSEQQADRLRLCIIEKP